MTTLEIRELHKRYVDSYNGDEVTAIGDVSFRIGDGEFVSVLGPSGCGKTTVLNVVAGFVPLTSGSVTMDGTEVRAPGPDRGVVFQNHALFPWKTVLGNVTFGLRMRGVAKPERERRAAEFLDLVGLSGFERKYPHELSGGMQQRLGVARVLANEPAVMLMDEPFGSIDAQTRRKLQEDLERIFDERRPTVFFVTHDIEEAVFLSDRVVVLSGRPSVVREVVTVDLPRPREWQAFSGLAAFRALTRRIGDLLAMDEEATDANFRG